MKEKVFLILQVILILGASCQSSEVVSITAGNPSGIVFDNKGTRILLDSEDLLEGFVYREPIAEEALSPPDQVQTAIHQFEGSLELIGVNDVGGRKIHSDSKLGEDTRHLPEFNYEFFQENGYIVPVRRGMIIADHPSWNLHLEPGRVWSETGDQGFSRASFPFALSWKGSNAILNGTMTFLFDDTQISNVWYQVTQETTISTSLDLWGLLDAVYHPRAIPGSDKLKEDFRKELKNRFPTKPIEQLKEDYPDIDLSAFGYGVKEDHMTWYGFVINGIQYLGGCQTRYGLYPYCESMRVPSYSTAKSAFASLVLMRLTQKYNQGASDLLIKDYLPEAADSPGNWEDVTFDHTLDMATGNYQTSERMVDEEHWDSDPFWLEDYYQERIRAAFNWPNSSPPGKVWVYRTFDTFIVTAAMQNYLREMEGEKADIFDWMVEEVYKPIDIAPGFYSTVRTKDDNWGGLPVGGYGLWWVPDDLAKITQFLNVDQGLVNGDQILDPQQLRTALQQDPEDRGVVRDGDGQYNNAFWADKYTSAGDLSCTFWVPHMYGYSGIVVALIPNGTAYYYASDSQQFITANVIQQSDRLIPVCEE